MPRPEVLIYLTGGQHWIGGVQYTRNLLSAVSLLPARERPQLVIRISDQNKGQGYEEEFGRLPGVVVDGPVRVSWFDRQLHRWLGRPLPTGTYAGRCRVAFPAKGPGIPDPHFKIYWIPDFQYKCLPQFFPDEERKRRDEYYARMHQEARLMVLSSRAVERDYRRFFPEAAAVQTEILSFTSVFSPQDWAGDPVAVAAKHGLPAKFAYAPNQIWQHKGHDTILQALALLRRRGVIIPVVCTGSASDYRNDAYFKSLQELIVAEGLTGQVHFLGLLPRQEQVQLFRQCALVIQASRFEGWSTVVEDTRVVGKPIVLSDLPVHLEQDPPDATSFKVGDPADLAARLEQVWQLVSGGVDLARERRARLKGEERTRQFARQFIRIVRKAEAMISRPE